MNARAVRPVRGLGEAVGDECPDGAFTLEQYLSIGECDGAHTHEEMYAAAMRAIFVEGEPCHRLPQLRWSKRHPGKYRWVLYEMWPMQDPVSGRPAVLVTEHNISQVRVRGGGLGCSRCSRWGGLGGQLLRACAVLLLERARCSLHGLHGWAIA